MENSVKQSVVEMMCHIQHDMLGVSVLLVDQKKINYADYRSYCDFLRDIKNLINDIELFIRISDIEEN